ncbi:MAG: DUF3850 domain-containing protein [Ruminococcaceae bacterium]|nr:DUF3850 domain-containing protein [Oscillospiraceae bacterium]
MAKTHDLKISSVYFDDVKNGKKPFEVRYNDRNFEVGDILNLREYDRGSYTGREVKKKVSYVLDNREYCKEGYVVLGLKGVKK